MTRSSKRPRRWCVAMQSVVLLVIAGCGYPVAEPMNMELITSLRTALSAKNETWLKANEDIVNERYKAGQMRDDELEAFQSIIQTARDGDWVAAEKEAVKFQKSQRPTAEQLDELRRSREGG